MTMFCTWLGATVLEVIQIAPNRSLVMTDCGGGEARGWETAVDNCHDLYCWTHSSDQGLVTFLFNQPGKALVAAAIAAKVEGIGPGTAATLMGAISTPELVRACRAGTKEAFGPAIKGLGLGPKKLEALASYVLDAPWSIGLAGEPEAPDRQRIIRAAIGLGCTAAEISAVVESVKPLTLPGLLGAIRVR